MPVFKNLDGTTKNSFSIGLGSNKITFRTNSGIVEYAKSDGVWRQFYSEIVTDPTGFPDRTSSTLTFVDGGTPSFTIAPTGATFDYYIQGVKHSVASKQVLPTPAEGLWYFYLDSSENLNATQTFNDTVFQNAFVASAYWDNTNQVWTYKGDERHGLTMDWETHRHLHESFGTTYVSGLDLSNFSIQVGAPTNDAAAQFAIASGVIRDEDIRFLLSPSANPAVLPVFYKSGASGVWRRQAANNIPTIYNSGTGLLSYNQYTGGSWQQTDVANTNYVLTHIFATNDPTQPHIAIQGQETYTTATLARDGATTELRSLVTTGLPAVEFSAVATVIYQTNSSWTNNAKHCKVVEYSTGIPYVDWRRLYREPQAAGGGSGTTDHTLLTNRDVANQHPGGAIQPGNTPVNYTPGSSTLDAHLTAIDTGLTRNAETITQASHGFAAGDIIYRNPASNIYAKAKSDAAATAEAVGIVESVSGDNFKVVYGGRITGLSGLTDGSIYFLSDVTAGLLTTSDPSIGSISKPLLIATSTTSGIVINMRGIQVSAAGSVRSGQTYKPASVTVSQTVFDLPWTFAVGSGLLLVFRNGILQVITTDYAETDSDTITLVTAITSTDEEMVFVRLPNPGPSQIYREVEAHTEGSGSPHLILDIDSDKVFTNEGSTAKNYHTLPAAVVGLTYTFIVQDSDGLRVTAATGDTIRFLDQVSATAGYAESTEVGSVATLVAINATEWVATFFIGTWTIT